MTHDDIARIAGVRLSTDWKIVPVREAGFFVVRGNEIHCYRDEQHKGKWLTRQDLERLTKPIFSEFGHLITTVRVENMGGHKFVQRLGFRPYKQDDKVVHYRCERLKHART